MIPDGSTKLREVINKTKWTLKQQVMSSGICDKHKSKIQQNTSKRILKLF